MTGIIMTIAHGTGLCGSGQELFPEGASHIFSSQTELQPGTRSLILIPVGHIKRVKRHHPRRKRAYVHHLPTLHHSMMLMQSYGMISIFESPHVNALTIIITFSKVIT